MASSTSRSVAADHQGQTAAPDGAPVHDQAEGIVRQTQEQGFGEGQEIDRDVRVLVVNPAREAFAPTVQVGAIRHMASDLRQIGVLARGDATDQPRQGAQVAGEIALALVQIRAGVYYESPARKRVQ